MTSTDRDKFHWARRVSRHKVRRLYESDAQGMLDTDLLDEVGYGIYARCCDMFQVWQSQRGRVPCRECGTIIPRKGGPHPERKAQVLTCPRCGWQVTWREYFESYTGKRMLPGSATEVFRDFVAKWPMARTPADKMVLIDQLIHEFHINHGIDGRPTGENVIQGNAKQVIALIEELAYGTGSTAHLEGREAWRSRLNDPIRVFRKKHSWARCLAVARELGIEGRSSMREDELVAEIRRIDPARFRTE